LATLDAQVFSVCPPEGDHHQGVAPTSSIKTDRVTVRQIPNVAAMDMTHVTQRVAAMDMPNITQQVAWLGMASSSHPTQVASHDTSQQVAAVQGVLDRLQ